MTNKFNNDYSKHILGTTNKTIIEMITTMTNEFYNKLYRNIQYRFYTKYELPDNLKNFNNTSDLIMDIIHMQIMVRTYYLIN